MPDPDDDGPAPREHLAWLMWCFYQGYRTRADRAVVVNWLLETDDQLSPNDIAERDSLLEMADEILDLLGLARAVPPGVPG